MICIKKSAPNMTFVSKAVAGAALTRKINICSQDSEYLLPSGLYIYTIEFTLW